MVNLHVLNGLDNGLGELVARGVDEFSGLVYVADFSGDLESGHWDSWVVAPTRELLLQAGTRVREEDTAASVLLIKVVKNEPDPRLVAYREAAMESLHGGAGSIALERAEVRALMNVVVVDETTTERDIVHTVRYLLDPSYNGFTTGATLHLRYQTAPSTGRRSGKVLVTGGGGTIGVATARAYQDAGYEPVLVDLSAERLEIASAELGGVDTYEADLTNAGAVAGLAGQGSFEDLSAVALVHGFQGSATLEDLTPELIDRSIAINGTSVALMIDAFAPLLARNGGSFAIVSSQAGIKAETVTSAYSAPKYAVVGLNRGFAPWLAEQGVSIHTLAPGPVDTPLLRAYFERFAGNEGQSVDEVVAERSASMPLGRFARPDEMGNALRFLSQLDATDVLLAPTGGETLT